jgi:hypothetical protein
MTLTAPELGWRNENMAEYDIDFAGKLIDAACFVEKDGLETQESVRIVIYLALLACEISLKAFLERAGFSPSELRDCSHDLSKLSDYMCYCGIEMEIGSKSKVWTSAACFRSSTVKTPDGTSSTIGTLLERQGKETSKYPNELRYGENFTHYPPQVVLDVAKCIHGYCIHHWSNPTRKSATPPKTVRKRR